VRILPWHNYADPKSGKYICVKNVVIEGQAFESGTTGLDQITNLQSPITNKVIKDGRLLILRDGKTYNALGY
jgi:hypothetical protein